MHSPHESQRRDELVRLVQTSPWFMSALCTVQALHLKSWCIGAGAVRNLVWDHLHGYKNPSKLPDVDLAYFDPSAQPLQDDAFQNILQTREPAIPWEVTNQAFVHTWFERYFGHAVEPLHSLEEAIATWPEYATCVGVTLGHQGHVEVIAPHGLEDLFAMRIQHNPTRVSVETFRDRVEKKQYMTRWPLATILWS